MDEIPSRIKTGVVGLDSILFGGVPAGSQTVIAGGPGAGKTMLSFEILYHIAKTGIPVAFITFDEPPTRVLNNVKETFPEFKDIDSLINNMKFVLVGKEPTSEVFMQADYEDYSFGNMVSYIEDAVKSNGAKVIAIDSLSIMKMMLSDNKLLYKKSMIALVSNLRRLGVTSFLIANISSTDRSKLKFSQEFFIFDGIIMLYQSGQEDKRVLGMEIVKMRGSNHSWALSPYDITPRGFKVFTIEQ
jgi:circadian clock protein KaiC